MSVRISASRLKTLNQCSLKFWYEEFLRIPSKTHHKTHQGSAIHKVFELLMAPKRLPLFRALVLAPTTAPIPVSVSRFFRSYDACHGMAPYEMADMLAMLRVAFIGIRPYFVDSAGAYSPPPRVLNEHRFQFELEEATISGFIDLLLVWPDRAVVIDLKSQGKKFSAKELADNVQSVIYQLATHRETGFVPTVDFILLRHGPTPRTPLLYLQRVDPLSVGALGGLSQYLVDMYRVVNDFTFEDAVSSPLLDEGFCLRVCPHRQPSDYWALVPKEDPTVLTPLKTYPLDKPPTGDTYDATTQVLVKRSHHGCWARWPQPTP